MTLRFIDFKTSKPKPVTSFPRRAQGLSLSKAAESNFEGQIRFAHSFTNGQNALFDVGRSMFDVRR
jgi:hypothetical protein